MQVNIREAKNLLSTLIEKAEQGEDVIIARSGKPVVRLTPIAAPPKSRAFTRHPHLAQLTSPELDKEVEALMLDTSKFDWLLNPKKAAAKKTPQRIKKPPQSR